MDLSIEQNDLISIGVSIICGSIIGFEREFKNKSTGFRTILLICIGSTLFTIVSRYGAGSDDRISANIITGIGFIGAGVIFKDKLSVLGLTTAAVIWTTAAIGMTAGVGYYGLALFFSIITLFILSIVTSVEKWIDRLTKTTSVTIRFNSADPAQLVRLEERLQELGLRSKRMQLSKVDNSLNVTLNVAGSKIELNRLYEMMMEIPEIQEFY